MGKNVQASSHCACLKAVAFFFFLIDLKDLRIGEPQKNFPAGFGSPHRQMRKGISKLAGNFTTIKEEFRTVWAFI